MVFCAADQRKQLFDYDQVLNTQRENVYTTRRLALMAEDLTDKIVEFAEKTADDILEVSSWQFLPQALDPVTLHCLNLGLRPTKCTEA